MTSLDVLMLLAVSVIAVSAQPKVILTKDISENNPVQLVCGNVTTVEFRKTLRWFSVGYDGIKRDRMPDPKLNITKSYDVGEFTCTYDDVEQAKYTVGNFSDPVFENSRASVTYNDGDQNRKLKCRSNSYPAPEFSWFHFSEGKPVSAIESNTNSSFVITSEGVESVLTFVNVTYEDAQTFRCEARNFAGNGSAEILVRVKNRYAAVWPFLGIVIEVVILIAVIFFYERHSKKVEENKSSFSPKEEEKPLNRDEGVEVRNRHSNK